METKFEYDVSPLGMLNNAKVWFFLYRQNINLEIQYKIVSIYCLLIGYEMLLKSYLVFLNKNVYSSDLKLGGLGHQFTNILGALKDEKEVRLLDKIEDVINKFQLLEVDVNNLRYPKRGDKFLLLVDYFKPRNDFDEIFELISSEVSAGIVNAFYKGKVTYKFPVVG